jgi:hypothetical protein
MELLWATVPAVVLAVLLLFTWRAVRASQVHVQPAVPAMEAAR